LGLIGDLGLGVLLFLGVGRKKNQQNNHTKHNPNPTQKKKIYILNKIKYQFNECFLKI